MWKNLIMNKSTEKIRSSELQDHSSRAFELLLVLIISISVFGLFAALCGIFEAKIVVLLSLMVTLIYGHVVKSGRLERDVKLVRQNWFYIVLIVLVGLIFRATPFHYVFGGQDQGVYVNIASSIERTGSVRAVDPVIDNILGSRLDRYINENYHNVNNHSVYLPGVYRTGGASGETGVEFQFYHLFPVWMAVFEGIFGSEGGVYALTFLSIISLLFCYQFVRVITGSDLSGFWAASLLALNPLHAFFSKWPVTEVPTLLFSLAGFSCFAVYWLSARHQEACNGRFLVLSALSFGCLFTTRISGFMYVPTLFALFASVLLGGESKEKRNAVALWAFSVFLLYGISVWYGLTWSANYSKYIYRGSFSKVFGNVWPIGVSFVVLALLLAFVLIIGSTKIDRFRNFLASVLAWFSGKLGLIFALIVFAGCYKIYQFAFTDMYASDPWGIANKGLESVAASSLVAAALYASPLIFFIFLYFMFLKWEDGAVQLAKFFLLSIFVYIALLQFVIPYQPYYDRYLLSEFVPYMIIFVVWRWTLMNLGAQKNVVSGLLIAAIIYSGGLTTLQLGKEEQRGAYEGLSKIAAEVGGNDLILLHGSELWGQIKTPLVYKFGKNVVSITSESLHDSDYLSTIFASYDNVYMLSSNSVFLDGLQYLGARRVLFDTFKKTRLAPSSVTTKDIKLLFYRFDRSEETRSLKMNRTDLASLPGTTGEVAGKTKVTNGKAGFLVFGPYTALAKAEYRLVVYGSAEMSTSAWVDVVSSKGNVQHAKFPLQSTGKKRGTLVEGKVMFTQPVQDIEIRVYVSAKDKVTLEGYELTPVRQQGRR
jgi:hypothetical protein